VDRFVARLLISYPLRCHCLEGRRMIAPSTACAAFGWYGPVPKGQEHNSM
jgi:hypothetical protein